AGYTDIIPVECGCGQMIELFRKMGRWVEDDAYIPLPGDYIFYDWDDGGAGDCTGWPDHVGIVVSVSVSGNKIRVIEGNKNDAAEYREIAVNGRYIRGYGIPDYASKATAPDASGPAGTGWEKDAQGKYRYKEGNGEYAVNKWLLINRHWYLFGKDGYMLTGWQRWDGSNVVGTDDPGEWYFLDNTPGGPLEGACWHSTEYGALCVWDVQEG
ncbi:CHAP domain-containing protein, partial [Clostridiaceae bacterium]|nr:CHAP domain-containing protein [Clostridiaceae bacterium]